MSHFKYMADCTDRQTETDRQTDRQTYRDSDIELTIVFSAALYFVCHTILSPQLRISKSAHFAKTLATLLRAKDND